VLLRLSALSVLLSAGCVFSAATAAESPVEIESTEQGFEFTQGDAKILFYQRVTKSQQGKYARANYVHPLYDLQCRVLTEDFPADHPHHRGVFWAWHQVLVGDQHAGDSWACTDFIWTVEKTQVLPDKGHGAALRVEVVWSSPQIAENGIPTPLVRETTMIRAHRATNDHRHIDFDIRLLALQPDLRIGGSNNQKGYGGFSVRVRLPQDIRFESTTGELTPQTTAVRAGPWLNMAGELGGPDRPAAVAVFCDPQAPAAKQPWILRRQRSMQNPAYPGREPVAISQKTPTHLRYRLTVHRSDTKTEQITNWYNDFKEGDK